MTLQDLMESVRTETKRKDEIHHCTLISFSHLLHSNNYAYLCMMTVYEITFYFVNEIIIYLLTLFTSLNY